MLKSKTFTFCTSLWLLLAGFLLAPAEAALQGSMPVDEVAAAAARGFRLIDARPLEQWQQGHLPGAVSLSWKDLTTTDAQGVEYRRLATSTLAERFGRLGIDAKTPLIIYGDADSSWGGEGWICWLLSELGHDGAIYLLDGGVQAWRQRFRLATDPAPAPERVVYQAALHPELDISTEELLRIKDKVQLVDTRSFYEWCFGSIPGAVRIHWSHFFTGAERRPIGRAELVSLLEKHGLDPQRPVIYYCSGGIRSAYAWTVHQLAGLRLARNYEGGMEAWQKRH